MNVKPFRKCTVPGCNNVGAPRGQNLSYSGEVRRKWCGKHLDSKKRGLTLI